MPPADSPRVSVIIVSYNTRETTLRCLHALHDDLGDFPVEVWIVDNASTDGSVEAVREEFPEVRIIENTGNVGFGAANNQAMSGASGEYFLLLNSDAFVGPGTVQTLIEYLQAHADTAIVGPRLLNADGSLQPSCWRFPTPTRCWIENLGLAAVLPHSSPLGDYHRWAHDTERLVDFVSGACMMVRRAAYEQCGGFDETFVMYAEETDWQRLLRERGWQVAFTPKTSVVHLGGASGASTPLVSRNHAFTSLDRYVRKHHGVLGLVSMRAATALGNLVRALIWSLLRAIPSRRPVAKAKARLHSWLFIRQATHWKIRK